MQLSSEVKKHILWWIHHLSTSKAVIGERKVDFSVHSDSSLTGWGGVFEPLGIKAA